jgi:hypothetical protein
MLNRVILHYDAYRESENSDRGCFSTKVTDPVSSSLVESNRNSSPILPRVSPLVVHAQPVQVVQDGAKHLALTRGARCHLRLSCLQARKYEALCIFLLVVASVAGGPGGTAAGKANACVGSSRQ